MWTRTSLWNLAKGRANNLASNNQHSNLVDMPVSFGKCGRLGKACRTLLPGSIAPNKKTTWQLLNTKNPIGHLPITPHVSTDLPSLDPAFDIASVLRSFPKYTAPGPSVLRIQHLLDVPLPTSITSSLRDVVNLLVSGKAPQAVSTFMAGGRASGFK